MYNLKEYFDNDDVTLKKVKLIIDIIANKVLQSSCTTLDSKVLQPTGNFHGQIVVRFLHCEHILNNATPFDAINHMFNNNQDA